MEEQFSLKGKTVLLSGAGGFFGMHFVDALISAGAVVVAVDKNAMPKSLASKKKSGQLFWYEVDYYQEEKTRNCYRDILSERGIPEILINNAFDFSLKTGFNDTSGRLENTTYDQFKFSFESGVYWAVRATQVFGFSMKEAGRGSIINVCSMYAIVVPSPSLYDGTDTFNPPGYSMAKAGLLQFTRYAASFLGPEVRVNALSPGAFPNHEGDSFNAIKKENPVLDRLREKTLLSRLGEPSDLVGGLFYLATDASSYVTGQNLVIDGGLTVT